MKIHFEITTEFGKFAFEKMEVDENIFLEMKNISKNYYESGFEMTTEEGDFVVISPELLKKSVLIIKRDEG